MVKSSAYTSSTFFHLLYLFLFLSTTVAQDSTQTQTSTQSELPKLTNAQVWGFGVLAGIGISTIGFLAALILLIAKKCCTLGHFQTLVKFLFSLSCGALVGDAVVHILAEAYKSQQTEHKIVSLIFILSIFTFLIIDRILHAVGIAHSHWVGEKCEGDRENHGHHHHELDDHGRREQVKVEDYEGHQDLGKVGNVRKSQDLVVSKGNLIEKSIVIGSESRIKNTDAQKKQNQLKDHTEEEQEKDKKCCHSLSGKGSAGYINILGSLIHNFIDGLALGVAFATANPTEIIPVLVAIIAHEIPRELGDVAVLLRNSFTEMQTMLCNGIVNFISLIGVFIGLAVVNLNDVVKTYIMVFVAGNFVYVASDIWQHIMKNKGEGAKAKNVLEFFGLAVGIGAMFALTLMESGEEHQH